MTPRGIDATLDVACSQHASHTHHDSARGSTWPTGRGSMATAEQEKGRQQEMSATDIEIAHKVWQHIHTCLYQREWNVTQLAEKTINPKTNKPYNRSMLYKWGAHKGPFGRGNPQVRMSNDVLVALEQALQLPHGELLRLAERPAPALPDPVTDLLTEMIVREIRAADLDQHEKEVFLALVQTLRRRTK